MTIRLPHSAYGDFTEPEHDPEISSSSGSEDDAEDNNFDDWVSDEAQPCKSLFEEKTFPSAVEALAYDKATHGVDLETVFGKLSLDFLQRIRLVNYIRKEKPAPADVLSLTREVPLFSSDEYLIPVLEDDPLLQIQTDDWSDEEDTNAGPSSKQPAAEPTDLESAIQKVHALEIQVAKERQELLDYRSFIGERLNVASIIEQVRESEAAAGPSGAQEPLRDDDSHYFQSYEENDIHAVMIQDKVRTATYANFILSHPSLFRDAVVLDVGCGTGILSLFAARAGAKRVFAVDASDIAEKAEKIVKDNGLSDVITVIRGKVEDITLPEGVTQVDIIISEWMGYALLYESMLDSVLRARDRFLKPEGVMAPSQCQMVLTLCEGSELFKERIGFWGDVYGFDLSTMADVVYDNAVVDVVSPETLLSDPYVVKDLHIGSITTSQLSFSSTFTLTSTASRRTKVHALLLYFDTFFASDGLPIPHGTKPLIVKAGEGILAEVWPVGAHGGRTKPVRRTSQGEGLRKVTSFSTGPESFPTHWKQTVFFLRDPIVVDEGTVVAGTFHCKKSDTNSRELDVEIHYTVKSEEGDAPGDVIIQIYKVR
ncbi:hypothetical protein JAAARDRAFT_43018, partial [Jaapia argillacea MUCL 33604]